MISTLLKFKLENVHSIFVFLYNIKKGVTCVQSTCPTAVSLETLTPLVNITALNDGYLVTKELHVFSTIVIGLDIQDFGITILMLFFAEFYSQGQYALFVHTFRCIRELENIEKFLLSFNQRSIKLFPNLATHETYGLKKQAHNFVNSKYLTVQAFEAIQQYMHSPEITPEKFIECVALLHINIIESFYIFTSVTKDCKVINECHNLLHNDMNYTFQSPIKSLRYDGDYWFEVPIKSIWFAYLQKKVKFSSYISCDIKNSTKKFEDTNIQCVVFGFIHENTVYPIIFEDPKLIQCWDKIIEFIHIHGFNCAFKSGMPNQKSNRIYFVKKNVPTIFKLEK